MTFEAWLASKGIDAATVTDQMRPVLQAQWKADIAASADDGAARDVNQILEARRQEQERVNRITEMTATALDDTNLRAQDIEAIGALSRVAIDGKWPLEKFEFRLQAEQLRILRGGRPAFQIAPHVDNPRMNAQVIEAAVCLTGNLPGIERVFPAQVLEAAQSRWKHGLGLGELVLTFARQNGYQGLNLGGNLKAALQAAFSTSSKPELRAAEVPSTYSLPNILANIANKYLTAGFNAVDQSWRSIASTRSVKDFKQITSFSLTGGMMYKKVAPSGEIQYGTFGEIAYNNRADTYGLIIGIARTDLINDDINALSGAATRLGRGGALKVNDVFWTVFLNNSTFFSAGNGNVLTGAGSALSLTALGNADSKFRLSTDPDGFPLGIMPRKLVVPTSLRVTALNLANATFLVATNTAQGAALSPSNNVLAGSYDVVSSPYMENSTYTGNSNTAWYLLADPADLPAVEMCFLNGVQQPVVETADADFNQLGIAIRGLHDFGCAMQEYRAGVRSAGA